MDIALSLIIYCANHVAWQPQENLVVALGSVAGYLMGLAVNVAVIHPSY